MVDARPSTSVQHSLAFAGLLLIASGLMLSLAFWRPSAAALILVGIALCATALAWPPSAIAPGDVRYPLLLSLCCLLYAAAPLSPALPQRLPLLVPLVYIASLAWRRLRRWWFWTALAILIASHLLLILTSRSHSDIDQFLFVGVTRMFGGGLPYDIIPRPDGPARVVYPPAVLILVAPFKLIGDMRWLLLLCELAAVAAMRRVLTTVNTGAPAAWQESLLLLPLALPRTAEFFYEATNIDWILLALAAIGILLALRGSWLWAGLVLGVGVATKQPFILVPGLFLTPVLRGRTVAVALAVAAAIIIPFLIQDPVHVSQILVDRNAVLGPGSYATRITMWSVLQHLGLPVGATAQTILFAIGLAAALALAYRYRYGLPAALMACGVAQFLVTLGSPFAGYNYYLFGLAFFAWGLAIGGTSDPAKVRARSSAVPSSDRAGATAGSSPPGAPGQGG